MPALIAGMVIGNMLSHDHHVETPAPAVESDFKSGGGEYGGGGASESWSSDSGSSDSGSSDSGSGGSE